MTQYIDKTDLVTEIEKRIKEHHSGYLVCLKDILSFLDTLEVKEIEANVHQQQDGLQWHPISEPMLPWHTCLLVHEKSYCIVRKHDDGRMFEITHNIEVREGEPFHLIKWIDLAEIVKA